MILRKKLNNNLGFTLIELLLSIGLFSIVASIAFSSFWVGIKMSKNNNSEVKAYQDVRIVLDLISSELENMRLYDFLNSYEDKKCFEADDGYLSFLIEKDNKLMFVKYSAVNEDDSFVHSVVIGNVYSKNKKLTLSNSSRSRKYYLIREELSFSDYVNDVTSEDRIREIVLDNLAENGFKVFLGYKALSEKQYQWKEKWQDAKSVPSHLKLSLMLVDDKGNNKEITKKVFIPIGTLGQDEINVN